MWLQPAVSSAFPSLPRGRSQNLQGLRVFRWSRKLLPPPQFDVVRPSTSQKRVSSGQCICGATVHCSGGEEVGVIERGVIHVHRNDATATAQGNMANWNLLSGVTVPCLTFSGALPSVEAEWLRTAERLKEQAGKKGRRKWWR